MARSLHYDARYRESALLADGTRANLRLIRPDDRERLAKAFANLSGETRVARFHTSKQRLTERELEVPDRDRSGGPLRHWRRGSGKRWLRR